MSIKSSIKSLIKNFQDNDVIFAYWWNPKERGVNNWGDALNNVLIQDISGSSVVWEDSRDGGSHVYYKDLDTKAGSRVSWVDSSQTNVAIS